MLGRLFTEAPQSQAGDASQPTPLHGGLSEHPQTCEVNPRRSSPFDREAGIGGGCGRSGPLHGSKSADGIQVALAVATGGCPRAPGQVLTPRRSPARVRRTLERQVVRFRRKRWTNAQIADALRLPLSTVSAISRRNGLSRLRNLDPRPLVVRYERAGAGELVHLDTKKLARIERVGHRIHGDRSKRVYGAGWEFQHVCIDDASRVAYAELLPDERAVRLRSVSRASGSVVPRAWSGLRAGHDRQRARIHLQGIPPRL